ncbi:sugar kinase [Cytophagales bacterium WSM2-2]|nr:sugar kinase [Cytophagales bacterium WSM2-2]
MTFENTILVIGKTRLEQLIERFNTKAQAKFYIEHSGGNFSDYEQEHETFHRSLDKVVRTIDCFSKHKAIERKFLPNFLFSPKDVVVALGQDGLVANTAKYVNGLPIIGVNPDPHRNDGVLLPYTSDTFEKGLAAVFENQFSCKQVTMAQAKTTDGQTLLAFNDLFVGPASHTSARYKINYDSQSESQSSSGLIVSTGAGSTGWLSSVVNMSNGIHSAFQKSTTDIKLKLKWEEDRLVFVVREPFRSKHSQATLTAGFITSKKPLVLESNMPFNGVIFSDGIESDFLQFNSGCSVEIGIAKQKANIVN